MRLPDRTPVLDAEDITYRYGGFQALDSVSLQLGDGEIVALVGRNGAGKSTLLRCLAGWYRPERGSLKRVGPPGRRGPSAGTVLVPDTPTFYAELTAWEHVQFIAQLHGADDWQSDARRLLAQMGLNGHENAYASSFSRGMQYKLALVVALSSRPRALLLDEPFGPLDTLSAETLWTELRHFAQGGAGVLISAHQMPAAALPDRYLLLEGGRLLADGTRDDLMQRYGLGSMTGEDLLRAALREEAAGS